MDGWMNGWMVGWMNVFLRSLISFNDHLIQKLQQKKKKKKKYTICITTYFAVKFLIALTKAPKNLFLFVSLITKQLIFYYFI